MVQSLHKETSLIENTQNKETALRIIIFKKDDLDDLELLRHPKHFLQYS